MTSKEFYEANKGKACKVGAFNRIGHVAGYDKDTVLIGFNDGTGWERINAPWITYGATNYSGYLFYYIKDIRLV